MGTKIWVIMVMLVGVVASTWLSTSRAGEGSFRWGTRP